MAVSVSDIRPVAHLPLILGLLRKLEVAAGGWKPSSWLFWMGPMRSTRWDIGRCPGHRRQP